MSSLQVLMKCSPFRARCIHSTLVISYYGCFQRAGFKSISYPGIHHINGFLLPNIRLETLYPCNLICCRLPVATMFFFLATWIILSSFRCSSINQYWIFFLMLRYFFQQIGLYVLAIIWYLHPFVHVYLRYFSTHIAVPADHSSVFVYKSKGKPDYSWPQTTMVD